jgi:hypothetical protein
MISPSSKECPRFSALHFYANATVEHPYPAGRMARVQQPATSSPFGLDIDGMCVYIYMYIYMLNGWLKDG